MDSHSRRKQHKIITFILENKQIDIKSIVKICNLASIPPYNFCKQLNPPIGYIIFRLPKLKWNNINWKENRKTCIKRLQLLDYYSN